jgi:hypothetical protein
MFDKVRHETRPLHVDLDAITRALQSIEEIEFAYLFGSRATGRNRSWSDVDLAVGLGEGRDLDLLGPLRGKILDRLDTLVPSERLDLIALSERTPAALRHQVFRHGRLLFDRNRDRRVRLQILTAREWGDAEPKRAAFWAVVRMRLEGEKW